VRACAGSSAPENATRADFQRRPATARTLFDFYTETKTVYVDFSGGLQRAQIDNYAD